MPTECENCGLERPRMEFPREAIFVDGHIVKDNFGIERNSEIFYKYVKEFYIALGGKVMQRIWINGSGKNVVCEVY